MTNELNLFLTKKPKGANNILVFLSQYNMNDVLPYLLKKKQVIYNYLYIFTLHALFQATLKL